jgi:predicted ATPase
MYIERSPGSDGETQRKKGRVQKAMITQIEIDGFKTFKDFKVELAPFQVIVGPNGSGKSNLFDALHLLSRLADTDLLSALQELRGDAGELFTKFPGGGTSERIHMAVEMLVDRKVRDELGKEVERKYTRLRYELEVVLHSDDYGLERPFITHESLKAIPTTRDEWSRKYNLSFQSGWLPELTANVATFIGEGHERFPHSPRDIQEDGTSPVFLFPDGGVREASPKYNLADLKRTVLSTMLSSNHSHAFAARQEFRSLRFLHLNPEVLRQPSSTKAQRFLSSNGSNLPTTLARIEKEDKFALVDISRDMANLVPGIVSIRVEQDRPSDKYVIHAETADGRSFSSQVLSDGTLRLLALATLRNDSQFHGVLCLEEPENGVHPFRLKNMARMLREMATDFNDLEQVNEPLRQVLVTTHSPTLISQPGVVDSLLFAYTVTQIVPEQPTLDVTRMVPVITEKNQLPSLEEADINKAEASYTLDEVKKYLDNEAMHEALLHFSER